MPEPWHIRMFGGLSATRNDDVINEFAHRKVAALLAYLARDPQQPHFRDELAREFWPGRDLSQSQSSLSNSLSLLRKQLERPSDPRGSVIRADSRIIALNPLAITTDLAAFEQCLRDFAMADTLEDRKSCLRRAADIYGGDMLPELAQDWIQAERVRLARSYVSAFLRVSYECDNAGEIRDAKKYASMATQGNSVHRKVKEELYDLYILAHEYLMRIALRSEEFEEARAHWDEAVKLSKRIGLALSTEGKRLWESVDRYGYVDSSLIVLPAPDADIRMLPILENRHTQTTRKTFGREKEVSHVLDLLFGARDKGAMPPLQTPFKNRVITIVGPSGYGKTRLAHFTQQILSGDSGLYPALTSWFVPLAHIRDASQLAAAVADGLSIARSSEVQPRDQVRQALRSRSSTLLVLDGVPDLPGAAEAVDKLLDGLTQVACVITAHRALEILGERVVALHPLELPDAEKMTSDLLSNPCVRLFEAQARTVRPGFVISDENAQHVARLCRLLRGIPLAIVIAAARSASFTPAEIYKNLLHDRDVWSDAVHGEELVNRTLYWTFRLLSPALQDFFVRLSVFRGGWTLEAARAVCGGSGNEPLAETYLNELSRCRLIEADIERAIAKQRFSLLEEPERLARQRIASSDSDVPLRHAQYFLSFVKRARRQNPVTDLAAPSDTAADLDAPLTAEALRSYVGEQENLDAALAWCLDPNHVDGEDSNRAVTGVALAAYLWGFWNQHNLYREGLSWLEKARDAQTPASAERLEIFNGAGVLSLNLQNEQLAHKWLMEGWYLSEGPRKKIDSRSAARMANSIGYWHEYQSRLPAQADSGAALEASRWYWDAIRLYGGKDSKAAGQVWPYHGLGKLKQKEAEQYKREAQTATSAADRKFYRSRARHCFTHAARHLERSLAIARSYRDDQGQSHVLESLAILLWSADKKRVGNDNPLAAILLEECLHIRRALSDLSSLASAVESYGVFSFDQENYRLSAALDGVARAMRELVGIPPHAQMRIDQERRREETRKQLSNIGENYGQILDDAADAFMRDRERFLFALLEIPAR